MGQCKCLVAVLAVALLLPSVAASADPAKEAYTKGLALLEKQADDAAIAAFSEAIRLDPRNARAYDGRGAAHGFRGEIDKAIADFTQAVRLDPKDVMAYFSRGYAYGKRATTTKRLPTSPTPSTSIRRMSRRTATGVMPTAARANTRATADCNRAIQLNPKFATAYCTRGLVYNKGGIRQGHRRLYGGHPTRSQRCQGILLPWRWLLQEGRIRQSHRRLHGGYPAQSKIRHCVLLPWRCLLQEG